MNLMKQFLALSAAEKRRVHFALCEKSLAVWRAFALQKKRIRYVDSVVGLSHRVDMALPDDAFKAALDGRDDSGVAQRYAEPITAMQDYDLEFPENVEFAYYSIYNLFCRYVTVRDIDDWIIVNQAISSETEQTKWPLMLSESLKRRIEPGAASNGGLAEPLGNSEVSGGSPSAN